MPEYPREIMPMKQGLLSARDAALEIWQRNSEGLVLVSGLPGTGKTTIVDLLVETRLGGTIPADRISGNSEVPYLVGTAMNRLHFYEDELVLLQRGLFHRRHEGRLVVAGIGGASDAQTAFEGDSRLLVIQLYCHSATRFINIIRRTMRFIRKDVGNGYFKASIDNHLHSMWDCLFPEDEIRIRVDETKPDIAINTSIGSRVNFKQAKQILQVRNMCL